jgi:hypothetical protein
MCEGYFESVSKKLVIEHKVGLCLASDAVFHVLLSAITRARPP